MSEEQHKAGVMMRPMKCLKLAGYVVCVLALSGPAAGAVQGAGEYTDCVPSSPQVTFEPGYAVSMCFEYERAGGPAQADAIDFGLGSPQSGLLWLFDPDNAEVLIKVHAGGHRTTAARMVDVPRDGRTEPFDLTPIPTDPFVFHWEEDQSTAGTEYSAAVNRPHEIEFEDEPVRVADNSSANVLAHDYNILLVDSDEASWSREHAWCLLTTMRSIPQETRDPYGAQSLAASQWLLTPGHVEGDIEVRTDRPSPVVLISEAAFVNANPRIATVDGKRGIWFSKRLHHALVRYATDNGRDVDAYERIFEERFGVTTQIRDYAALTRWTTGEGAGRFQRFHPWEIVTLLNMLEEFPSGMHKCFRTTCSPAGSAASTSR